MNAERQLIGSLLIDQSRYEDVSYINSEMFEIEMLGSIFSVYEHAEGEVNPLVIITKVRSPLFSDEEINDYLRQLVSEHDSSISDKWCAEKIFNEYKVRTFNNLINRMQLNSQNVDEKLAEIADTISGFQREDEREDISTLSDLTKLKDNYFTERNRKDIKLGFEKLDRAIGGFDAGDTTIIAARPAVGKSAFTLQVIRNFGRSGIKTGYFNLEMSSKQVYERSIASASGIDLSRIRLGINFLNNEKELFDKGNEQLEKENNVYIISGTQTLQSIRQKQKKFGFQIIVIDYLQLIKIEGRRNGNRASEVGEISRGLKAIASDFGIPVIALSQLNRVSEQNKDREPTMSELRESGDLEQDASTIIMMWNPNRDDSHEKMIKVEKSRNGTDDRVRLYFDGKHMTFSVNDYQSDKKEFEDSVLDEIPFD